MYITGKKHSSKDSSHIRGTQPSMLSVDVGQGRCFARAFVSSSSSSSTHALTHERWSSATYIHTAVSCHEGLTSTKCVTAQPTIIEAGWANQQAQGHTHIPAAGPSPLCFHQNNNSTAQVSLSFISLSHLRYAKERAESVRAPGQRYAR